MTPRPGPAYLLGSLSLGVVIVALSLTLSRTHDLAKGKRWQASSSWNACEPDRHRCGGARTDIFFHTLAEPSPWVEIDLGAPVQVSSIEVSNRKDCCAERAIPLFLLTSLDGKHWREVAHRSEVFLRWRVTMTRDPIRYLRLEARRHTTLHLERVEVESLH